MIRRFEPKDLDQIMRIEAQAFPKSPYTRELLMAYHRGFPATFLVFEENTLLAYLIFKPDGHVVSLAVDPAHRRRRIGTRLMKACESRCRADRLLVEVREGNIRAQRFYERLGFRMTSRIRRYYGSEDAYVMEKARSQTDRKGITGDP
jgi:ribosomal-protein-alanine N-acetyltransferase